MTILHTSIREGAWLARTGRRQEARDLFLNIVRRDRNNEIGWLWLSELMDDLEDQVVALENVLTINPKNLMAKARLKQLQSKQRQTAAAETAPPGRAQTIQTDSPAPEVVEAPDYLQVQIARAKSAYEQGNYSEARAIVSYIIKFDRPNAETWLLSSRLVDTLEDEIAALEKAVRLDSECEEAHTRLAELKAIANNPKRKAAYEAQKADQRAANANTGHSSWKGKRRPRVVCYRDSHPTTTLVRCSLGLPLFYVALLAGRMQGASPLFWVGLPLVVMGSFLVVSSQVTPWHPLWQRVVGEAIGVNTAVRATAALAGWLLVLLPYLWIFYA